MTDIMESPVQEFEKYPLLACHIMRMEREGHVGSNWAWSEFLAELNKALAKNENAS